MYGLWRSLYPTGLYPLIQTIVGVLYLVVVSTPFVHADMDWIEVESTIMKQFFEGSMWILLIAAAISIPLFGWLYHRDVEDKKQRGWREEWFPLEESKLLWTVLGSAALALFCNLLVSILPLGYWLKDFEEVSEALDTGGIWLQMAAAGFLVPLVEELVMRGLMYQRLRRMIRPLAAMTVSAIIFGIFHGNVIQGVYAFFLGMFFAWLMERFQRLLVPTVAHMTANLFVLLLEDGGGLRMVYQSGTTFVLAMVVSGGLFLITLKMLKSEG